MMTIWSLQWKQSTGMWYRWECVISWLKDSSLCFLFLAFITLIPPKHHLTLYCYSPWLSFHGVQAHCESETSALVVEPQCWLHSFSVWRVSLLIQWQLDWARSTESSPGVILVCITSVNECHSGSGAKKKNSWCPPDSRKLCPLI